jgi:hypothetical protein
MKIEKLEEGNRVLEFIKEKRGYLEELESRIVRICLEGDTEDGDTYQSQLPSYLKKPLIKYLEEEIRELERRLDSL